jgi:hypothetical protein
MNSPLLSVSSRALELSHSTPRIAFVDTNAVAVWIINHRHAANWGGHRFDAEFDLVLLQMRNGGVEILHFEGGAATIWIGFETSRTADGDRIRTKLVFSPLAVLRVSHGCWFEVQDAFVKCASAFHVSDRVAAKGQFDDFHSVFGVCVDVQ